jgi:hypothetical protein
VEGLRELEEDRERDLFLEVLLPREEDEDLEDRERERDRDLLPRDLTDPDVQPPRLLNPPRRTGENLFLLPENLIGLFFRDMAKLTLIKFPSICAYYIRIF